MSHAVKSAPAPFDLSRLSDGAIAGLRNDPYLRLEAAIVLSIVLHILFVALFTQWGALQPTKRSEPDLTIELVNAKTAAAPQKPDILAQHNLEGGGNTDADRRARTPLPVTSHVQEPDIAMKMRQAPMREVPPVRMMTQSRDPAPAVAAPDARPRSEQQAESPPVPSASDIMNSSREMIQLQGQISRSLEEYNKRPRRTFIGARAREFRFARYLEDWRQKIERVGELNYPSAARGVYGSLLVTVAIRVDGTLEKAEINRSSGHKVLDQAALNIVRLAAPFAPLPPDIAQDTDILSVTRTWTFTRSDRFQAE